ncbi:MAG: hypothetical protein REI95_00370 [Oxalicibacterium faecigallinarum]|uniref:hypothetical protein n=1 Tax=Oxalicibacterium faecigallinarum TaxID=573741 RepID=UPI0028085BAA|nr:hypothetical protein [Oxalicibacterium faecigallinarum]MDQ7968074.1 hypothetical protein [Oxalicibacterium faecigallinarum]
MLSVKHLLWEDFCNLLILKEYFLEIPTAKKPSKHGCALHIGNPQGCSQSYPQKMWIAEKVVMKPLVSVVIEFSAQVRVRLQYAPLTKQFHNEN